MAHIHVFTLYGLYLESQFKAPIPVTQKILKKIYKFEDSVSTIKRMLDFLYTMYCESINLPPITKDLLLLLFLTSLELDIF